MSFTFENHGTNTYLVYEIGVNEALDTMSLGMLTNNSIPGFAPASFTQMDTTKYIKYNVSAKVSVKQLFSGSVNKKRLIGVFAGVVDAMLSAEDYMLDPNTILLDTDYMFADVTTCETEMICLPIMNVQQSNLDLAMFFKNILFTTQFDQTENCDHVAQLINYLNTNPVLVLGDFKELLKTISNAQAHIPMQQPAAASIQPIVQQTPVQQVTQPVVPAQEPIKNSPPVMSMPESVSDMPKRNPAMDVGAVPVMAMPKVEQNATPAVADEKPMSWFYLMQHYNKENAAIYKAQQEAKKAKNATSAAAKKAPSAPKKATPVPKKTAAPVNSSFAVPGASFAIPGQASQPVQQPVSQPVPRPEPVQQAAPQPVPQPFKQVVTPPVQPAPQPASAMSINFGETTVLSAGVGETTVLSATSEKKKAEPHLVRTKNNEKIPLNKPVFRIGKERSYVDYFIGDNTAVSRSHANIIDRNGEFAVVDTNSTNHTYVNGAMIQSGVETKLSHGDKLRLANEEFEFRMY